MCQRVCSGSSAILSVSVLSSAKNRPQANNSAHRFSYWALLYPHLHQRQRLLIKIAEVLTLSGTNEKGFHYVRSYLLHLFLLLLSLYILPSSTPKSILPVRVGYSSLIDLLKSCLLPGCFCISNGRIDCLNFCNFDEEKCSSLLSPCQIPTHPHHHHTCGCPPNLSIRLHPTPNEWAIRWQTVIIHLDSSTPL